VERIFATHRLPTKMALYYNNGPPFNGHELSTCFKENGISHHIITPIWPQANGEAESFMKQLNNAIRSAIKTSGRKLAMCPLHNFTCL
jgi:transposase InsO family protein